MGNITATELRAIATSVKDNEMRKRKEIFQDKRGRSGRITFQDRSGKANCKKCNTDNYLWNCSFGNRNCYGDSGSFSKN